MKITTYGGRHLSHIQPFLSLFRVLFRARTFLLFNSLSLSNGKTTCRTASNLQAEILFPSGSMARKCREWLSPSGRVARKRRERSLSCTAESFNSTIFRHKKSRRYFRIADLIFIKTNSFLYNCIAYLARFGFFKLYYKAPCFQRVRTAIRSFSLYFYGNGRFGLFDRTDL
mgnify:CR=1 FL=1